jgi:DNA-binding NarL/FixJ family response regulator
LSPQENPQAIRIGVLAGEPIRLEGLNMVFEEEPLPGRPKLIPVVGTLQELVANSAVDYLVVDINSGGLNLLDEVRRARPGLRQIVIGPKNDDELVLKAIVIGARAYLDSDAGPETVRQAVDIVVSGSIWAPRRLLSKLIDRLLGVPESSTSGVGPQLTVREREVLKLVLLAKSNREIARQLGIDERTVKAHVGRMMRKLGADNRTELSVRAIHRSLLDEAEATAAQE